MSTTTTDAFGAKVEEYRERLGLLQKELAGKVGLSPSHLNRIEKGTRKRPGVETVRRMIKALRLTQSEAKNLVQVAGLSPKVLDFMDEVQAPVHPRILRKKAAQSVAQPQLTSRHTKPQVSSTPLHSMVRPALGLPASLLDTTGDQIKEIGRLIDSLSLTDEEEEIVVSQLDTTKRLLKFIAAQRNMRKEG